MTAQAFRSRFQFLADALNGGGGFAPTVTWSFDNGGSGKRRPVLSGASELVPYLRESPEKFAGRCAVAVYENHLRSACERFTAFLGRRKPMRSSADAPLVTLMLDDADLRGSSLDQFMVTTALEAKARGSALVLIDMPDEAQPAVSLADQIARRRVPHLTRIEPERVSAHELDPATGLFTSLSIDCMETIEGKGEQKCTRTWDANEWRLEHDGRVIKRGPHKFGQCPVLALTEDGSLFPHVGKYAQIADLSRRLYNARSELNEILRGQTFSLLTLQVTAEQASTFNAETTAATIGTHSMLVHQGQTPAFIAPDASPAETYQKEIAELAASIRRIAMDDNTEQGGQPESGLARRLRFEQLNADLATFAAQLQQLERRMWTLFHRALNTNNRVEVAYPTDFNLIDTLGELDILEALMRTGFPPAVLAEKRRVIVSAEFDASEDDTKTALLASIDEALQEPKPKPAGDGNDTAPGGTTQEE